MISFSTPVQVPALKKKITYADKLFLTGSCFVENIGQRLKNYRFACMNNPYGIQFNPLSIAQTLENIILLSPFKEENLIYEDERWVSLDCHSSINAQNKNALLQQLKEKQQEAHAFIRSTSCIIITWGTAWVYEYIATNTLVANCHKLPAKAFRRRRLSTEEIVNRYSALLEKIQQINPKCQFIFTVSPIRHLKDGLHENQISKSTLLLAIDKLQQKFPTLSYFPSYEIVLDELRDYRFYADDMAHLSTLAVDYIWEKVKEAFICPDCLPYMERIQKVNQFFLHKPFNPKSENYQKTLENMQKKSNDLDNELRKKYHLPL